MIALPAQAAPSCDHEAAALLRRHGFRVADIQELARDQSPFALRAKPNQHQLAPGLSLSKRSLDLDEGCFTNVYSLTTNLELLHLEARSSVSGFHLRDLVVGPALAATTGAFNFSSDDPDYQTEEPCLDLCWRSGCVASLPTATKPTLLVGRDHSMKISTLSAQGTLRLNGVSYRWIGSKHAKLAPDACALIVYGAANCRVIYRDHPATGFVRTVDPHGNRTPRDSTDVDHVFAPDHRGRLRLRAICPGGGTDLFTGSCILRSRHGDLRVGIGTVLEAVDIDGHDLTGIESGLSLGPSVADTISHENPADDACLGASPFAGQRHARTLIELDGTKLAIHVLDGAPGTDNFRGLTPAETVDACDALGADPAVTYHLDGGASSKIAYADHNAVQVVGSLHYMSWPAHSGELFRWLGLSGRRLHSTLVLIPKQSRTP